MAMQNTKATLLTDIHSYCKGLKLYGSKGEKVKVISIRGNVAIVEGKTKFSVKIEDLEITKHGSINYKK